MCFCRHLKLARVSQVLIKLGKVFHKDAAATKNEPSPALVRVRFISTLLQLAERSALAGRFGRTRSHRYTGASSCWHWDTEQ